MPVKRTSNYIDVDFDQAVPHDQALGAIMESKDDQFARAAAPPFSSYTPLIPRSEWKQRADEINPKLRECIRNVKDQKNEGSCVGNGGTGQWQFVACQQFGADSDYVILSAAFAYSFIGSSPGSGAYVGDMVNLMMEDGCIPESGHGYTYAHQCGPTGFYAARDYRKANPECMTTAAQFMSLKYYTVSTVDEWATALLQGHPILKGRSQHCIFDFMWDYDEAMKWYAGYCNSWKGGPNGWGETINEYVGRGLGYDSERSIANQSGWALVGVKVRDELTRDIEQPKVAL